MAFTLSTYPAPSSINAALSGGTLNDWNPTGLSGAEIIWISASAPTTLNGLVGGVDGRIVLVMLRVGSSDVTLASEAAGSSASNRFGALAAGTLSLTGVIGRSLQWDGTTSRWRPFSG